MKFVTPDRNISNDIVNVGDGIEVFVFILLYFFGKKSMKPSFCYMIKNGTFSKS